MKKNLAFLLYFGLSVTCSAQTTSSQFTLPNVVEIAPNAASLGRYGEIPVGIKTGVPDIIIPLYQLNTSSLELPISISYHASGIKVKDMASSIGLGWSLNAGGSITKVVQGIDDYSSNGFKNMVFPDTKDPLLTIKENLVAASICERNKAYALDGQPDLFYYNFSNKTGKFLLKNHIVNSIDPGFLTIPYDPIKITQSGSQFIITSVDGTSYFFGKGLPSIDSCYDQTNIVVNGVQSFPTITNGYHLTSIISSDKSDTIQFKYIYETIQTSETSRSLTQTVNITSGYHYSYNYSPTINTNSFITQADISEIDFKNGKIIFEYSGNHYLSKIRVYNNLNNIFTELKQWMFYQSQTRLDSLREIGGSFSTAISNPPYVFSYYSYGSYQVPPLYSKGEDFWGYFNGKINNQDLTFVAAPVAVGYGTNLAIVSAAYKRIPDSNYLKVGTLKSIKYPTGGNTSFDFEPNQIPYTYTHYDTTTNTTSGYITESTVNNIPSVQFTVSANLITYYEPTNGNQYNFKLDFTGYHMCSGGGNCIYNDPTIILKDITSGVIVAQISLIQLNNASPPASAEYIGYLTLITGHTYKLYFPNPVIKNSSQIYQNRLDATGSGSSVSTISNYPVTQPVLTGGLRIRKIFSSDAYGKTIIKEYKYTQSYYNSQLFHGDFDALATSNFTFPGLVKDGIHLDSKGCATYPIGYNFYSENLSLPLGSVNNNGISYNQVEEYQSDGGGNYLGKTVYEYNSAIDFLIASMPFYKVDNEYLRYLLSQKVYKYSAGTYILIKNISYQYLNIDTLLKFPADTIRFYTAHALADNWIFSPGDGAVQYQADASLVSPDYYSSNQYFINKYYYISPKLVLKSSTIKQYDDNGNQLIDSTIYDYNNAIHLMPTHIKSFSSTGQIADIYTQYVLDYSYSSCINTANNSLIQQLKVLKSNLYNIEVAPFNKYLKYAVLQYQTCLPLNKDSVIDAQIAFRSAETNFKNSTNLTSSLIANYNSSLNSYNNCNLNYYNAASTDQKGIMDLQNQNNILPTLQITKYKNSILNSTLQNSYKTFKTNITMPSTVRFSTMNNPLETRLQFFNYDSYSKIKTVGKANDILISYVWDYNNSYVIAEVKNADSSSIAFTSFESAATGGWTLPTSNKTLVADSLSPTGSRYLLLSAASNISVSGLSASKTYVVSYWSKSGSWTVNGSAAVKTGKTINGWTYFEHLVGSTNVVSVTGSGGYTIDELRLYPSNAQMTTYTYIPLIGLSSQCDINNFITYYFYDGLGRLQLIKDQDRNIIKKFDYKYQLSQNQ